LGVEVLHGQDRVAPEVWARTNGPDLDLVVISRPDVAERSLDLLRAATKAPIVYYGHDLHFRRSPTRAQADAMRARERAIWNRSDLSLYLSDDEAAEVRRLAPSAAVRAVVPYGLPARTDPPREPDRRENWILFVAGFAHHPNAEAAVWFARTVLPAIRDRVPGARLAIVGSHPTAEVLALASPHVAIFPNVTPNALDAWYQRARIAVVPLLTGAGVKLKVVEALWHGLPLVMTSVGAQGLPAVEAVAAVEDDAMRFSQAAVALLTDDALWRSRSEAQRDYAKRKFSEAALHRSLRDAFASLNMTAGEACLADLAMA
jgi:O-antigen biosynthesis protein